MLDQFELSPELSWFEIARKMKGIGLNALQQWKGEKEVSPISEEQAHMLLNSPEDTEPQGMPLPTKDPFQ